MQWNIPSWRLCTFVVKRGRSLLPCGRRPRESREYNYAMPMKMPEKNAAAERVAGALQLEMENWGMRHGYLNSGLQTD